jgi:hypothetical protein
MRELFVVIAVFFVGFLFIVSIVTAIGYPLDASSCASKAEKMEMPHSYGLFQGCMVQDKHGRWWPIERYSHITVNADEE